MLYFGVKLESVDNVCNVTSISQRRADGFSRCGRWLYASNRGYSSIELYAIHADTGALAHRQSRPSEGRTPRFFALHPQGHVLYALNEDSHSVVLMPVDPQDGTLGPSRAVLDCGSPVCMVFRPERASHGKHAWYANVVC